MNIKVACLGLLVTFPIIGTADVTFDLLGNSGMFSIADGQSVVTVTNNGIVATLEASEGVLNQNAGSFGVNGPGSEDDAAFMNLGQYIDITFDQSVTFNNVKVSDWGNDSAAEIQLGITTFTNQGLIGSGITPYNFIVNYGETVRIIATGESDNAFSVDSFTVDAIPEPAVISFVAAVGIGGLVARRWFS